MGHSASAGDPRRALVPGWLALAILGGQPLCREAAAQGHTASASGATPGRLLEIIATEGRAPVHLAASQVVRVGRVENFTTIDTAAWVQQRTTEPVEAIARRLRAAGQHLVALTDLNHNRIYLAIDRIVLVRDSNERHAAGARAAIVMVGLRFNTDVAVRETAPEVVAAIQREARPSATAGQPTGP